MSNLRAYLRGCARKKRHRTEALAEAAGRRGRRSIRSVD